MILTRKEKEDLVIKLAQQGKSTRYIAQVVHISLKDIGTILRMYTGEYKETTDKPLSVNSKAFKLLKDDKSLVDVAIALNIEAWEVLDRFNEYLQLLSKDKLMAIYRELGDDDIQLLVWLYDKLKMYELANKKDIHNILQQKDKLKNLDKELYETAGEIGRLNSLKVQLKNEVAELMEIICHCNSVMNENTLNTSTVSSA